MTVGFGNLGGIVASNVFFHRGSSFCIKPGYGVGLGLLWICGVGVCCVVFGCDLGEWEEGIGGERDWRLQGEDVDNLGDDHPSFRFAT